MGIGIESMRIEVSILETLPIALSIVQVSRFSDSDTPVLAVDADNGILAAIPDSTCGHLMLRSWNAGPNTLRLTIYWELVDNG